MIFNKPIRLFLATGMLCASASAATIFNFDADSLGTSTNFTDTANGIQASFSSSADPGGFVVYSSMFDTLTGNVLGDPGPAGQDNLTLTVRFSRDLSALSLDFATADFADPSSFTLTAFENAKLVGSSVATGSFLNGFSFPEGQASFTGGAFNTVAISSTAPDFAIDNLTATATPEPAGSVLLAEGLLALALASIRRKSVTKKQPVR